MVINFFKKYSKDEQLKKDLFAFLAQMEKNLEFFYVMDQRQFVVHGFLTDIWPLVKDMDIIKRHETIAAYARATEDFNHSFKNYKEFESWYAGDINNKTPENARKLHALKNEMDMMLRSMEAIIIFAGQDLEREMIKLGVLKA